MKQRSAAPGATRSRDPFADFATIAHSLGLTTGAELLAAFHALPEGVQVAIWRDLADRLERERQEAGWIA